MSLKFFNTYTQVKNQVKNSKNVYLKIVFETYKRKAWDEIFLFLPYRQAPCDRPIALIKKGLGS